MCPACLAAAALITAIVGLDGDIHLERVTWQDYSSGETSVHPSVTYLLWPEHLR